MKKLAIILLALLLALPACCEEGEGLPAGYVLVSTATQAGWLPLPIEGEQSFPLAQLLPDGTQSLNVIHLTPEGMWMEEASCEGQDCVGQGEVTLENRDERILYNMIICLPNQVVLQLYTPEETMEMLGELPVLPKEEDADAAQQPSP